MTSSLPTTIGLGRLVDFIIRDAQGRRLRVTPTGERWLAWKADTRDLVVLQPGREAERSPASREAKRHRVFHGAEPRCVRQMEWPTPTTKRRTIGLIEAVTYVATGIRSPSKGPHHWIHQFGDRGEHGHGTTRSKDASTYAERFMPQLDVDASGHLFVVRRASNRFIVRDWILG